MVIVDVMRLITCQLKMTRKPVWPLTRALASAILPMWAKACPPHYPADALPTGPLDMVRYAA